RIAQLAEVLPRVGKVRAARAGEAEGGGGAPTATRAAGTKLALRRAFAGDLPRAIVERPKASFPLPFRSWVADHGETLRSSGFAREIFTDAAIELVAADPSRHWRLAWP